MSRGLSSQAKLVSNTLSSLDHRQIGFRQKLFFFNELSKGSCFFQPRGARIYNKLIDLIRHEYKKRGYHEIITPNIFDSSLWKQSGHWTHYEDNMIKFKLGQRDYSLKPMNCPAHCIMYRQSGLRTSNKLPVRLADFGVLHRNELSGSILGLTRVRRFQQDDAHIFCTPEQIQTEVNECLNFATSIYKLFNFSFNVKLSLRPHKYLGSSDSWDQAEESLRLALRQSNIEFSEEKNEGAFYGPKIDMVVKDTLERSHQCATIQLDFQLPEQFDLRYLVDHSLASDNNENQVARPVIIHRAILGSIERFIAMIAENCKGRWPFWLSPLQAQVIPVHTNFNNYARWVCDKLREHGFWTDCDLRSSASLNLKIREATLMPYQIILVVGQRESDTKSVTSRLGRNATNISIDRLIEMMNKFETDHVDRADIELLKYLQ